MRLMGGRFVDDEVYESYVLFALRSILGDRRAKSILRRLRSEDAAAHEQIMIEAWRRHADLPDDLRTDKSKAIAIIIEEGARLQLAMIERARSTGVFDDAPQTGGDAHSADRPPTISG